MPSARLQQSGSQNPRARVSIPPDLSVIRYTSLPSIVPSDSPARRLFVDFIERYLQIEFQGFQSGFEVRPDLILFAGPHRSTLAVPTTILLESSREDALEMVRQKRVAAEHKFQVQP